MSHTAVQVTEIQLFFLVLIFIAVYAMIITEKLNRAVVAVLGGIIVVFFGLVSLEGLLSDYVDWNTIALLVSMMIIVSVMNQTGIFQFIAVKAAKKMRGNPLRILHILCLITAVSSAFLDNVTTVLLIVPVTISITRTLGVNPVPFLISEIIACNVGGTATLIGDPPNIMIAGANPHLSFLQFLINLGPIVIIIYWFNLYWLSKCYKKELFSSQPDVKKLMKLDETGLIHDRRLMRNSLIVFILTLCGFMLHSFLKVDVAVISMAGASLMLLGSSDRHIEKILGSLEWVTIFFFIGLFMLVGGLVEAGVITQLAMDILDWTGGNFHLMVLIILWSSGLISAVIDNIPFVATMIPLIEDIGFSLGYETEAAEMNVLWWALSLGACLGGNGSLIGATANVIVAGLAVKNGYQLGFIDFLKIGVPLMLFSLLFSTLYIIYRYLLYM